MGAAYSGTKVLAKKNSILELVAADRLLATTDTDPPTLTATLANDTGNSDSDGVTSDPALSGSVTDESGVDQLLLTISSISGGATGGPFDVKASVNTTDGSFSFDRAALESLLGQTLVDGNYTASFEATDTVGNSTSTEVTFLLDTMSSSDIALSSPPAGLVTNVNVSVTGQVVNVSDVATLEAHFDSGSFVSVPFDVGGNFSFDSTYLLDGSADGTHSVQLRVHDLAGNVSVPIMREFVLDSVIATPVITEYKQDTGISDSDGITNDTRLVFSGTAEPNSTVTVSEAMLGGVGSAVADSAGLWTVDATSTILADDTYSFSATAQDVAGNVSAASTAVAVQVDTEAPTIILNSPGEGLVANDNVTAAGEVTDPSGVTPLEAQIDSGAFTPVTVNGANQFSFATTFALDGTADGIHTVRLRATDVAGNVTNLVERTFELDTQISTPVITAFNQDTGASDTDGITNDNTLVFSGTADADSIVTISAAGLGVIGSVTADVSGNWTLDASATVLADGSYSFTAAAADAAGNTSATSASLAVNVDTTAPSEPIFDLDPAFDSDPVGDLTTTFSVVTLTGTTEPNTAIEILETGATTTSDASGDYSFQSVALALGANAFTVRAVDVAGNASDFVATITRVEANPPVIFVGLTNDTGSGSNDGLTTDPAIFGTVTDENDVTQLLLSIPELAAGPFDIISELDPGDGSFALDRTALETLLGSSLADGDYTFRFEAGDEHGNFSAAFDLALTLDTDSPTVTTNLDVTFSETFASFNLLFSEEMDPASLNVASYILSINGGPNDGTIIPIDSVEDLTGGVVRVNLVQALDDADYLLTIDAGLVDITGNLLAGDPTFNFTVLDPAAISSLSPTNGETMVSVTRETIVRFDEKIDPATVTDDAFHLIANGERIVGRIVVSSTEEFATLFYDQPLPASTEVRIVVDGNLIVGRDGQVIDATGDGQSDGVLTADFRTLPLTRITETNVFGFVRDSRTGDPIVGATIRVDAFPSANVVTDTNGRFELVDTPAPEFFVHVDGTTATNTPAGFSYPNVGKPFHSVPGQTVQIEHHGNVFDIFLPPLADTDVQLLSPTTTTHVGFGAEGKTELQQMFPGIDPTAWDRLQVIFEPGAAVDEFGNVATQAAIIPVNPDRLPAPLPPNLNPELVISIQAFGATNFDIPAAVTFPNLEGLAPGEKSLIFSFNHDAGQWEVVGSGTVSQDGLAVVSDPGVGILAPGWHSTSQGVGASGAARNAENPLTDTNQLIGSTKDALDRLLNETYPPEVIQALLDPNVTMQPLGTLLDPKSFGESELPWGATGFANLDRYSTTISADALETKLNELGLTLNEYFDSWRGNMNAVPTDEGGRTFGDVNSFQNVGNVSLGDVVRIDINTNTSWMSAAMNFIGSLFDINTNILPADVMATDIQTDRFQFSTVTTSGAGKHPVSGSREFGYEQNADGSVTFYTEGLDTSVHPVIGFFGQPAQQRGWTAFMQGVGEFFEMSPEAAVDNVRGLNGSKTDFVLPVNKPPAGWVPFQNQPSGNNVNGAGLQSTSLPVVDSTVQFKTFAHASFGLSLLPSPESFVEAINSTGTLGDVSVNLDNSINYSPAVQFGTLLPGTSVNDSFTVTINDGAGAITTVRTIVNNIGVASFSQGFYRIRFASMLDSAGTVNELTGQTALNGNFSVFLAPNSFYTIDVYDPVTNLFGHGVGLTRNSGVISLEDIYVTGRVTTDTDDDGLGDFAEFIIGTDESNTDSDGDGITDASEIQQGLNPLDGISFPTGTIASLLLFGEAKEVVVEGSTLDPMGQTAYVATGSHGLAIVDASQFDIPIVLGQLNLAGDAVDISVDSRLQIAAVAAGSSGLHVVDVSDPMLPTLSKTIGVASSQVEVIDGVAYVAVGSDLRTFSLLTGDELQTLSLGGDPIAAMAREGLTLYVMDSGGTLTAIDISGEQAAAQGTLQNSQWGGNVFVGNGIAYVTATNNSTGGYATIDVSDPNSFVLISNAQVPLGTVAPRQAIAVNGSGLGLLVGDSAGVQSVDLYDVSNPLQTDSFITQFTLPEAPSSVRIGAGVAFVASGSSGLQVINYLPFDGQGQAPTATISTALVDADPIAPGFQVQEGATVPIIADIFDDVQVRNAELLVDGEVAINDVSFPFEFNAVLPTLASGATSSTVQVRVTDTGGNVTTSAPLDFELIADTIAPTVLSTNPQDGVIRSRNLGTVRIEFSEAIDAATISSANVSLINVASPGTPIDPLALQLVADGHVLQADYPALVPGDYQLVIDGAIVTDRAGNPLGTDNIVSSFTVVDADAIWINPIGGFWDDVNNWASGELPQAGDDVLIAVSGIVTIEHRLGNTQINRLTSANDIRLSGGTLQVATLQAEGELTLTGGTLLNTEVIIGSSSAPIQAFGGILDGVILGRDLSIIAGRTLTIANGLSLNGSDITLFGVAAVSSQTILDFVGTGVQTLSGNGEILYSGDALPSSFRQTPISRTPRSTNVLKPMTPPQPG